MLTRRAHDARFDLLCSSGLLTGIFDGIEIFICKPNIKKNPMPSEAPAEEVSVPPSWM